MPILARRAAPSTTPAHIKHVAATLLFCLFFTAWPGFAQLQPYRDEQADFVLKDQAGITHRLSDYRGKVVLVNFWASWCPPCIYEMPALQKLKKRYADRPFEILTINVGETKNRVRKFSKAIKLDLPVLLDSSSKTYNNWNITILPTSFIIDSDGQIRYRILGDPGWENEEILNLINNMLP